MAFVEISAVFDNKRYINTTLVHFLRVKRVYGTLWETCACVYIEAMEVLLKLEAYQGLYQGSIWKFYDQA